jgi:D-alanine-D-alanine ligase
MSALPPFERKRRSVAVLLGGTSAERPVSLVTGAEVAKALAEQGYAVETIDVGSDIAALVAALTPAPDAVFNALHGSGGEDGTIQGLLDLMHVPYTHSGRQASALAMDKPSAKRLFAAAGLRCAKGMLVSREDLLRGDPLPRPYVVKPPAEGSSVGVAIIRPGVNALPFTAADWPYGDEVLVETFIPGRELTVAAIGEGRDTKALGAIEIKWQGQFFDYHSKYTAGQSSHLLPPPIHEKALAELLDIGVRAHQALGCRGVSRADVRYDDTAGEPGELYLLEVNTQPGMTPISLVPDIAKSRGISFGELVAWMVEEARFG